jgi:putative ABC transport system permease protein
MRNKLFTFISLFGISLTLTILIVGTSFYDYFTKSNYPTRKQDRILYTTLVKSWDKPPSERNNSYNSNFPSYYVLNKCAKSLETPERTSIYTPFPIKSSFFINSKKAELQIRYTDEEYWNILDFKFLSGRPYNNREVAVADRIAVIGVSIADNFFEGAQSSIGKTIEVNNIKYKIVGVVKDASFTSTNAYGNCFLPITTSKENLSAKKLESYFTAMILAKNSSDFPSIKNEFQSKVKTIELPLNNKNYIKIHVLPYIENFIYLSPIDIPTFYIMLLVIVLIIILIPSLNLVNLNVNRISERLSEIGVRKSFGARRVSLIGQFITENIVLTLIGGIIAFVFSYIILKIIQSAGIIPTEGLLFNFRILFIGLIFCFLFGSISGFIPAYRMSRLQIVESLKNGES